LAHAISTSGLKNGPKSTQCEVGETTPEWVGRHTGTVQGSQPNGQRLTTTWTSANGTQSRATERNPNESDESFLLRHIIEYMDLMAVEPPVP